MSLSIKFIGLVRINYVNPNCWDRFFVTWRFFTFLYLLNKDGNYCIILILFRSRYLKPSSFPVQLFLQLQLGYNPSYVWRSIFVGTRELEINIQIDRWVSESLEQFKSESSQLLLSDAIVSKLFNTSSRMQKEDMVRTLFPSYVVEFSISIFIYWLLISLFRVSITQVHFIKFGYHFIMAVHGTLK